MKEAINILESLEGEKPSVQEKILKDSYESNENELRFVFETVYGHRLFGMNNKSWVKVFNNDKTFSEPAELIENDGGGDIIIENITLNSLKEICDKVESKSGHDKINYLKDVVCDLFDKKSLKWIVRLLSKDLRIGLQVKTFNKIMKSIGCEPIDSHGVQLAGKTTIDDWNQFPVIAEVKYDGMRAWVIKDEDNITIMSRSGKVIDYVPELEDYFKQIEGSFIIDGEINCENFSLLSKRIGRKKDNIKPLESLHFVSYDIINYNGKSYLDEPQVIRRSKLLELFNEDTNRFRFSILRQCSDRNNLQLFYDEVISDGQEGVILKLPEARYIKGNRKHWFKVKPVYENTFEVIDGFYGNGKNHNKISTLLVTDKSKKILSNIGSGLTDEDRDLMTELYVNNTLTGRYIDVKYNELSKNKDGSYSLRHPSFLKLRDDKTVADKVEIKLR